MSTVVTRFATLVNVSPPIFVKIGVAMTIAGTEGNRSRLSDTMLRVTPLLALQPAWPTVPDAMLGMLATGNGSWFSLARDAFTEASASGQLVGSKARRSGRYTKNPPRVWSSLEK